MALPDCFYFSDETREVSILHMPARLPRGSALVFRHYNCKNRTQIAFKLSILCKKHRIYLIIAQDPALSHRLKAAGCHLAEHLIPTARTIRRRFPRLFLTAACHSEQALLQAARYGVNAAFLSPLFPTTSHPGARPLPLMAAAGMVRRARLPVLALGGVTPSRLPQLRELGFAGFGAISALE